MPGNAETAHRKKRDAQLKGRSAARLGAVQALYQMEMSGTGVASTIAEFEAHRLGREVDGDTYNPADKALFRTLVEGVVENQRKIDPQVNDVLAKGWPLARVDSTMRAILRAAVYELAVEAKTPPKVVISEYLDIANAFFDADIRAMVNGVLDTIAKSAARISDDSEAARS